MDEQNLNLRKESNKGKDDSGKSKASKNSGMQSAIMAKLRNAMQLSSPVSSVMSQHLPAFQTTSEYRNPQTMVSPSTKAASRQTHAQAKNSNSLGASPASSSTSQSASAITSSSHSSPAAGQEEQAGQPQQLDFVEPVQPWQCSQRPLHEIGDQALLCEHFDLKKMLHANMAIHFSNANVSPIHID
jgi:hypothetical protein